MPLKRQNCALTQYKQSVTIEDGQRVHLSFWTTFKNDPMKVRHPVQTTNAQRSHFPPLLLSFPSSTSFSKIQPKVKFSYKLCNAWNLKRKAKHTDTAVLPRMATSLHHSVSFLLQPRYCRHLLPANAFLLFMSAPTSWFSLLQFLCCW